MYEIEEFYAENGQDLKQLLKSCIYNYYIKNKNTIVEDELKAEEKNRIIKSTNKEEILSMKGVKYV